MTTVLVVDDEKPIRDMLALLFAEAGYQVVVAAHGGQALEIVAQHPPDLVVSDVMMPRLDGAELTRRLKHDPATKHIPIILMSAAGSHLVQDARADAFIAKPFDINDMEALVQRWVGHGETVS